jgi:hypothetical protein
MGMALGPSDMVAYDHALTLDGDGDAFGVNDDLAPILAVSTQFEG